MFNIFYNFNNKKRFSRSLYISKLILSNFGDIYRFKEGEISHGKLSNIFCLFENKVCKLLLSWTTISRIEFNSKVLCRTSWIVTCCQQDSSKTISPLLITVANVGWASWSWHYSIFGYVEFTNSISTGKLSNNLDSFCWEISTISSNKKSIFSCMIKRLRESASFLRALK